MDYRRMPIEIESPEQLGYDKIKCNLTESSVSDARLDDLNLDLRELVLCYGHHVGKPELRRLIAADAPGCNEEDVLVTAGAAAALFIVATTLLKAGEELIVAKPNYATNLETPRAIGAKAVFLQQRFQNAFRVDLEELKRSITTRTKLVSLTVPHNPTGTTMTLDELQEAVRIADEHGCWLLIDETYREMAFSEPLPPVATLSKRAISVGSMSKAYGLPGLRIGWITCRDQALMERFLAAKEQIYVCNPVVDEEIAARVLAKKRTLLPAIQKRTLSRLQIVRGWMAQQQFLEWVEPQGGAVCFPRFRPDAKVNADLFYKRLNEEYGTYVGPGHWFDEPQTSMRIGFGWPADGELAEGLRNIEAAARDVS
jgi:aspartate/methionine/tyrosine aminotransferase